MKKDSSCAEAILAMLLIPILMVVSVVASGYALSILWVWFVVPIFHAPTLSIPAAFGLSMIVGFMTYQETKSNSSKDDDSIGIALLKGFLTAVLRPGFALLLGYIIHLFM